MWVLQSWKRHFSYFFIFLKILAILLPSWNIHKRVRFSKAIQRAIPQKIRRSASMLKCETTPFCNTPKYATIVLRSSGALKHWLVSSVASLAGSLVWGAVASNRATHTTTTFNLFFLFCWYFSVFYLHTTHL